MVAISLDERTLGNGQSIAILRNIFPKLIISIDKNASLILMSIHLQFRKLLFLCYVFLSFYFPAFILISTLAYVKLMTSSVHPVF